MANGLIVILKDGKRLNSHIVQDGKWFSCSFFLLFWSRTANDLIVIFCEGQKIA